MARVPASILRHLRFCQEFWKDIGELDEHKSDPFQGDDTEAYRKICEVFGFSAISFLTNQFAEEEALSQDDIEKARKRGERLLPQVWEKEWNGSGCTLPKKVVWKKHDFAVFSADATTWHIAPLEDVDPDK